MTIVSACSFKTEGLAEGALDSSVEDTGLIGGDTRINGEDSTTPLDTGSVVDSSHDTSLDSGVDSGVDSGFDSGVDSRPIETGEDTAPTCTNDLSGIGAKDFRIAFTITTSSIAYSAVLNQRSDCKASMFWDVRMLASGTLQIETDDKTTGGSVGGYTIFDSTLKVNDGAPHAVVITRTSGVLSCTIDGAAAGSQSSGASFGALPPLATAVDVCEGVDGTTPLVGVVAGVCVSPL